MNAKERSLKQEALRIRDTGRRGDQGRRNRAKDIFEQVQEGEHFFLSDRNEAALSTDTDRHAFISPRHSVCDCPDHARTGLVCKHLQALAALVIMKLPGKIEIVATVQPVRGPSVGKPRPTHRQAHQTAPVEAVMQGVFIPKSE